MAQKSVRFAELVKRSGKPQVATLWVAPKNDRSFMRAVKENRVLTIHQPPTSKKKESGQIGFHEAQHSSYLIFPRPLPQNPDARVIGVNYDFVETPTVSDPIKTQEHDLKPPKTTLKRVKKFSVTIRRIAATEEQVVVAAKNKTEAEKQALSEIQKRPFDISEAVLKTEVRSVE